jgi:hypothetical protein
MNRTRGRLVVACLAVIGAAVAVSGGSAGNRDGDPTFKAVPGPGSVTYGENIAYSATLDNTSKATFTQVKFQQSVPVATWEGEEYPAGNPVAASCPYTITDGVLTCTLAQLAPNDPPARVTIVWQAPTIPSPTGCDGCLTSHGTFFIKEGKPTNGNEEIPAGGIDEAADLLAGESSQETLLAGGYELAACTAGGSSLKTNQAVSLQNPVASSFCLPSFAPQGPDLGLATTITELEDNAHQSEACIAALGEDCADPEGYVAADFGPGVVTYTFKVAADALPNGYKITQVFHNGEELTAETCERTENPECLVSITLENFQGTKIWTIIATSETNGPWNW